MKAKYDPEQVTQPLEVARQAALVGGASGMHIDVSSFHIISDCRILCFNSFLHVALSLFLTNVRICLM